MKIQNLEGVANHFKNKDFLLIDTILVQVYTVIFLVNLKIDFPPEIVDASKGLSPEQLKKKLDEAALCVKTCYW